MYIRELKLASELLPDQNYIDFSTLDKYICTSNTGLGIYLKNEYLTVGQQRILISSNAKFNNIQLTISVKSVRSELEPSYQYIRNFIQRFRKSGLRLYYKAQNEWRFCRCEISELNYQGKVNSEIPITLTIEPKTLWLTSINKSTIAVESSANLFTFALQNTGAYASEFEYDIITSQYAISFGSKETTAQLNNNTNENAFLLLKIYGQCTTPIVTLKNKNNEVVATSKVIGTIPKNYYVEINSNPANIGIWLVNNITGERQNWINNADDSTNVYLTLPNGNYELTVKALDGTDVFADVFYNLQNEGA